MDIRHLGTQIIKTKRLILRKFTLEDADSMYKNWASDPEVSENLRWNPHKSVEETKCVIKKWIEGYESIENYQWAIVKVSNGELFGCISVSDIDKYCVSGEISGCFSRNYWGQGYATEAIQAVIHFMIFDVGLNRIEAIHSICNPSASKVFEKVGMKYEGVAKEKAYIKDKFQDCKRYAIVKSDIYAKIKKFKFNEAKNLEEDKMSLVCIEKNDGNGDNILPSYGFNIFEGEKHVGVLGLNVGFNDDLYYIGHLSCEIYQKFRGKGYGSRACKIAKSFAKKLGMKRLLIICDSENVSCMKVNKKLGSKLIRIVDKTDENNQVKQLYIFEYK